jgi:hypothetical protein
MAQEFDAMLQQQQQQQQQQWYDGPDGLQGMVGYSSSSSSRSSRSGGGGEGRQQQQQVPSPAQLWNRMSTREKRDFTRRVMGKRTPLQAQVRVAAAAACVCLFLLPHIIHITHTTHITHNVTPHTPVTLAPTNNMYTHAQVIRLLQSEAMLPAIWFIMSRKECDTSAIAAAQSEGGLTLVTPEEEAALQAEVERLL